MNRTAWNCFAASLAARLAKRQRHLAAARVRAARRSPALRR